MGERVRPDLSMGLGAQEARAARPNDAGAGVPALRKESFFERLRGALGLNGAEAKGPLRLKGRPDDPLKADINRGRAVRGGHLLFRGIEVEIDRLGDDDMPLPEDFDAYIDGFAWLRDLAAAGPLAETRAMAERLTKRWLDKRGDHRNERAWRADIVGFRFMTMAAQASVLLASEDARYRDRVLMHLASCERYLAKAAPKTGRGTRRIVALAGGLSAALLLTRSFRPRGWYEKRLGRAIDEGLFADGGVPSRSPLALKAVIEALALLQSVCRSVKTQPPTFIDDALRRTLGAMRILVHADGGTGAWQGSAGFSEAEVEGLIAACRVVPRPPAKVIDWGYQRLVAGESVIVMDAAPPPGAAHCESGCASTLAFEFSAARERIVVNCGGGALVGAHLSAKLARGLRSTAAHSTLCMDDVNSTAVERHGALGAGADTVDCELRETPQGPRLEASHDGYVRNFGLVHRRTIVLGEQGRKLRGLDTLLPEAKTKKGKARPFAIRFHLYPGIEVAMRPDGQSAMLRLASGSLWHFHATDGPLSIEQSLIVDAGGRPRESWQLVIAGEAGAGGASSGWLLNQMS